MKKNKVVAALLAGALLVGGTFVGTKALFSSTATSNNHLELTTGKVKISVNEDSWVRNVEDKDGNGKITANDNPYDKKYEQNSAGEFKNIKPGDTFTRRINVINQESTYNVVLDIVESLKVSNSDLAKYITVDSSDLKGNTMQMPAGTNISGYITVSIKDTPDAWEAFNGMAPLNIDDTYTITATQAE